MPGNNPLPPMPVSAPSQPLLLRALRGEPVDRTPIWLMRQVGRYQKSYRDLRAKVSMLELCKTPSLACQVTVEAVREISPDAAIIFSDLLLPVEPLGLKLEYLPTEGPRISPAVRTAADVSRLRFDGAAAALTYSYEALRLTRAALPTDIPLLAFSAALVTESQVAAPAAVRARASRPARTTVNRRARYRLASRNWVIIGPTGNCRAGSAIHRRTASSTATSRPPWYRYDGSCSRCCQWWTSSVSA